MEAAATSFSSVSAEVIATASEGGGSARNRLADTNDIKDVKTSSSCNEFFDVLMTVKR